MQKTASCNRSGYAMPYSRQSGYRLLTKILLVMKLTTLLLTAAFLTVHANGVSQSVTLSGKNLSLEKVFEAIRTQTGYHVFCDFQLLKDAPTVNVSATKMPLTQFLNQVFNNQSLQFLVREQTIFVSPKAFTPPVSNIIPPELTVLLPITGIITDAAGNAMPGAYIRVKGTDANTVSDGKGKFTINASKGDIVEISFVGYQPQAIKIGNNMHLEIIMQPLVTIMDEVQVNVSTGYQTISKERTPGAYNVVTAKELESVPANNLLEKMEGKVPGVRFDIRNNQVQIRTINTYSTNSAPLIVIDGFPMIPTGDNQALASRGSTTMANGYVLSSFNPADIEQITFLKDAVATSIWGARGANGVIVIETKKGKKGTTAINYSSTVGFSQAPSIAKLDWMSSAEYVDLEKEMLAKGFLVDAKASSFYSPLQTTAPSDVQEWTFKVKRGQATQAEADAAIAAISERSNYGQIEKYLLRTALSQQHNLSISGGGDLNTYYLSVNYNKDQPIFRSNRGQNIFVTANFTNDLLNRKVKLRTGISYQNAKTIANQAATEALGLSTTSLRPYDMLVDENGTPIRRSITMRQEVNDSLVKKGYLPFTYNAIDELQYSNTINTLNQIRLNAGLNVKLTKWANLDVSGMYQRNMSNAQTINEINSYAGRMLVNTYTTINTSTGKPVYNLPYGGSYYLQDGIAYDYNLRGLLNINHNFSPDHQLTALAGGEIRESYNKSSSSTRYGYDADGNTFAAVNATTPYNTMYGWTQTLGNNLGSIPEQKNRYISWFGNAAYQFKGKYILSGSFRFDDYTLLGVERSKRAKPFWSAGAKWDIRQESFMQDFGWLKGLDLRATYGTGGAVPLGGYNVAVISLAATDPNTQLPIASITNPANQQLGWELTKTANLGVDMRVLKNRLIASFDIYSKRSEGILAILPVNATYGWSSLQFNTGTLKSHGLELSITGKIIDRKDWGYTSVFNFAWGKTKITDNRYNTTLGSTLAQSSVNVNGYPVGGTFVYRSAGLDPTTGQTQIYDRNKNVIKSTTNLTSTFDINDIEYVGIKVAPYHGGFMHNLRYKNLELGVQMTYYMGHVFLRPAINNYPNFAGTFSGTLGRQKDLANRWRQTGDEEYTDVPGLSNVNFNSITRYRYSDKLVRKADNIRLQQISLSYRLPASWLPTNAIKGVSLSGNVRNLCVIWAANKEGLDPEYLNPNANYYSMPPVPSYVFNINVSF
jgi:TonB-linked SusC/RagA family outer membrane protein